MKVIKGMRQYLAGGLQLEKSGITLQADNHGEGGVFSLYALVRRYRLHLVYPAIIGAGALLADGIITPPITVTSAIIILIAKKLVY